MTFLENLFGGSKKKRPGQMKREYDKKIEEYTNLIKNLKYQLSTTPLLNLHKRTQLNDRIMKAEIKLFHEKQKRQLLQAHPSPNSSIRSSGTSSRRSSGSSSKSSSRNSSKTSSKNNSTKKRNSKTKKK